MPDPMDPVTMVTAREDIRELVLLYSRALDRGDMELLATLFEPGAQLRMPPHFEGSATDYIAFLGGSAPYVRYSGHHVCNHLISIDGDQGEGEVYCIVVHVLPDGQGGHVQDVMMMRYADRYRKGADGRWRFAHRTSTGDMHSQTPLPAGDFPKADPLQDPSVTGLSHRLFARGARA